MSIRRRRIASSVPVISCNLGAALRHAAFAQKNGACCRRLAAASSIYLGTEACDVGAIGGVGRVAGVNGCSVGRGIWAETADHRRLSSGRLGTGGNGAM